MIIMTLPLLILSDHYELPVLFYTTEHNIQWKTAPGVIWVPAFIQIWMAFEQLLYVMSLKGCFANMAHLVYEWLSDCLSVAMAVYKLG